MELPEVYLKLFQPASLADLEHLNFSDRLDSKSIFAARMQAQLLELLTPDYYILEEQRKRVFHYESLYFDTPDLKLFNDHHRGLGHRQKVRYRTYTDTDSTYFEIKTKDNKGRSHKSRTAVAAIQIPLPDNLQAIVRSETNLNPESLIPTLSTALNRVTLIHRDGSEKVTFDSNIHFNFNGTSKKLEGIVITEVKQKQFNPESCFFQVQHKLGIRPATVSKYCLGISLLHKPVKANRFKAGILHIEKITE